MDPTPDANVAIPAEERTPVAVPRARVEPWMIKWAFYIFWRLGDNGLPHFRAFFMSIHQSTCHIRCVNVVIQS